jgi:hypothetical protein
MFSLEDFIGLCGLRGEEVRAVAERALRSLAFWIGATR